MTTFITSDDVAFNWQQTGNEPNDLICYINAYTLRVEKMSKRHYWWALYYEDSSSQWISSDSPIAESLEVAKALAEYAYVRQMLQP